MYELSRVRLHSVGPPGARYQDVVLDLSGVGAPVPAPRQEALFADPESGAVARRPSPASVFFLENGGGKSVLLRLIFSVVLPGRRQVVGTTARGALEKFVLANDVAHVALEWQHTGTGERIVTGKVSEWRGRVVSSDPGKLAEAWYALRPTASFGLAELPFTEGGRMVSLAGFRERLAESAAAEPALDHVWETGRGAWSGYLESLGLDPELFAYQRRMNAGEGEAADAFTFRSDAEFVDWLLGAVLPDEDARSLGEVVEGYAARLAERGALAAERDFVGGALERLGPLREEAGRADGARDRLEAAERSAARLVASFDSRRRQETGRLDAVRAQAATAQEADAAAEGTARRLTAVTTELRRRLTDLRLRSAVAEQRALDEARIAARTATAAWRATDTLLESGDARAAADGWRTAVGAREREAAPALTARDTAARRLARGLLAAAAAADTAAAEADERARTAESAARAAADDDRDATRLAERERGRAAAAERDLDAVRTALESAVEAGLVAPGDAVPEAAATARADARAATARVGAALADLDRLAADAGTADRERHRAGTARAGADRALEDADRALTGADADAAALAGEERLAALLGVDAPDLDSDLPTVTGLLAGAVSAAEVAAADARLEAAADVRTLTALGAGGLLPPPAEVAAAVDVLEAAGIRAWPGWQALRLLPAADRDRALAAVPHLVAGVLVASESALPRAREVLAEARLLPRAAIAVGLSGAVAAAVPQPGVAFVVPPNPAMYDEERAAQERSDLTARVEARAARLAALAAQAETDRRLAARCERLREQYPPGSRAELRATRERAASAALSAATAEETASARAVDLERSAASVRAGLTDLRAAEAAAATRADHLERLAERVAADAPAREAIRTATEGARAAEEDATAFRRRARGLRDQAAEARRAADDARRNADTSRAELAGVAGADGDPAPDPGESLPTLRAAYRTAVAAYAAVEVDADLGASLRTAEETEARTRAAAERLPAPVRAAAAALLDGPDGSDAPARLAAIRRAERALADAEHRYETQLGVVGGLETQLAALERQQVSLEPYGSPDDIPAGEALLARAAADRDAAVAAARSARAHSARLTQEAATAATVADGFTALVDGFGDLPAKDLDAEPFTGDVEAARGVRADVHGRLRAAVEDARDAEKAVRRAADALATYAAGRAFEKVASPVRTQLVSVDRDTLPAHAAGWETALRARLRTLSDDLAQIDRHRATIVVRLRGLVEQALATLRTARRLSRLPDGLGDWSGQEFLRIRFADPDPALLDARLADVVDAATDADTRPARRDGLALVLAGVHAALHPQGVTVEMLKPDAVLRTDRVRVAEMGEVFSGGQLLTAAIVLYCTMAALRANDRGLTRRPHAGVLFLDNPIGRASAGYLLELQLAVAAALGVQLVYTTGLFDTNALAVFPLIVRLRNDADLRAGRKYLSVAEEIRSALPDDGPAVVTATRVFTRPAG